MYIDAADVVLLIYDSWRASQHRYVTVYAGNVIQVACQKEQ